MTAEILKTEFHIQIKITDNIIERWMFYKVPNTRDNRLVVCDASSGDDDLPCSVAIWASDGKRKGI
jgi:hypothetical protein